MTHADFQAQRQLMLMQIAAKTIYSSAQLGKAALGRRVMEVLGRVPRHDFVPLDLQAFAYEDSPLPIGCGKTISQPFIVAVMTELLALDAQDKVLEIGTGLGYQTAVLAELASRVFSIELIGELALQARRRLAHYRNIEFRIGNGYRGWPERGPFDKIIVTAAPELIPPALIQQLKPGGIMVLPAGRPDAQRLLRVAKDAWGTLDVKEIFAVRFSSLEQVGAG